MAPQHVRQASHSGSWYSSRASQLNDELSQWLDQVRPTQDRPDVLPEVPVRGCKAIIAPHAGYSYSGPAAAWAYKCIDPEKYSRIFILGPSHHYYLDSCALSKCREYQTPLGNLPIDLETVDELRSTGRFQDMEKSEDEDEHSIEMHLPYIRKVFENRDIKIVPILVGAISTSKESEFGKILAPYLADPKTFFVVSSDFCHWGTRFRYTHYHPPNSPKPIQLSSSNRSRQDPTLPIHVSIARLDRSAIESISFPDLTSDTIFPSGTGRHADNGRGVAGAEGGKRKGARESHGSFARYLGETKNTVCGRHPIGVLLACLAELQDGEGSGVGGGGSGWGDVELRFVRYERSGLVEDFGDSSVSYASAYVRVGGGGA